MPLAMLAVQYGVTFALSKAFRPSALHSSAASPLLGFASGGAFVFIGLAFTVIGLLIVYNGTQDIVLTLGYFVVGWVEGYFLSSVFAVALLASLGIHNNVTASTPHTAIATSVQPGQGGTGSSEAAYVRAAQNGQGLVLGLNGPHLNGYDTLALAAAPNGAFLRIGGRSLPLRNSMISLNCIGANGLKVPFTQIWPQNSLGIGWQVSPSQADAIVLCDGSAEIPRGGTSYHLDSWTLGAKRRP